MIWNSSLLHNINSTNTHVTLDCEALITNSCSKLFYLKVFWCDLLWYMDGLFWHHCQGHTAVCAPMLTRFNVLSVLYKSLKYDINSTNWHYVIGCTIYMWTNMTGNRLPHHCSTHLSASWVLLRQLACSQQSDYYTESRYISIINGSRATSVFWHVPNTYPEPVFSIHW